MYGWEGMHDPQGIIRVFHRSAAMGAAAWLLGTILVRPGLAEALLLAGPLVAVPLGLALAVPSGVSGAPVWLWRAAAWTQLPAGLLLLAAFGRDAGPWAAALSLPWLAFTALAALLGLLRLLQRLGARGALAPAELAIDTGLVYLAVGGVWTLFSRWGQPFLGFREPLVLLTGAHFHFAGFVLPILTGLAGRELNTRLARIAALGVVAGVPLTAAGITLSQQHGYPLAELFATAWMLAAAVLVAVMQLQLTIRFARWTPAALWALSGFALLAGMALAGAYALGAWLGTPWLDIPQMVALHATANVAGFALPGLVAWTARHSGGLGGGHAR